MKVKQTIIDRLSGQPRVSRAGDTVCLNAAHRLPSSGQTHLAFRLVGLIGAVAILVAHYRPDTPASATNNFFLEQADTVIAGLAHAFERLAAVAHQQTLNVPLESLQGWLFALIWLGGIWMFCNSGLLDLYTYLTNREQVRIEIDDQHLSVRHGAFRFAKKIARNRIQDVLILANHSCGYDVMLQHAEGLTRLASIYGNLSRPTLFKLRLQQALSEVKSTESASIGLAA
ncbi:hypothetical protein [Sneathiella sp.]|uniref:hypothetical protein n=1 Tax=Sneathiella sp. TaxID=1964365 RepID=UPI0035665F4A